MKRQLIFVHGRAQEFKRADDLKAAWVAAWRGGLARDGLEIPIPEERIHFPYYGQTLFDLVDGARSDDVAEIIVRGADRDVAQRTFLASVLDEVRRTAGISDEQLREVEHQEVIAKGPQNWRPIRGVIKALDRFVPGASGAAIAAITHDVYQYLRNPGVRDAIDQGVRAAIEPGVPAVVIGHSLGTVVSYNVLKRDGEALGWAVPLHVTLGSPLAVSAIRNALMPLRHPSCVARWFNAMDERDVVALYPLDTHRFGVDPAIENKIDVCNSTPNRHGISGYLNDPVVARLIYDALTAV